MMNNLRNALPAVPQALILIILLLLLGYNDDN